MSGEWKAAAHRGQLTLDVLSTRRAIEEGYRLPGRLDTARDSPPGR